MVGSKVVMTFIYLYCIFICTHDNNSNVAFVAKKPLSYIFKLLNTTQRP